MVKINVKDIKYYNSLNLNVIVKQRGSVIASGVQVEQLDQYLSNPECEFFVKRSKTHRFYKYLTGQIFIGYFCAYVFGAISLMFAALAIYSLNLFVASFVLGTGAIAFLNYKVATIAYRRLLKSLNKSRSSKS